MENRKPNERVLETASELFKKQGFNSTGINQILKEAKVAKASFYEHFVSKDLLAVRYLEERHKSWFAGLYEFAEKTDDPKEKIIQSFRYLQFMNEKEDFSGCVFLNMLSELKYGQAEAYQIIRNHKQDLRHFFDGIVRNEAVSLEIYLLFEACLVESQVFRNQDIINNAIEIIKQKSF
ncbi:MAG: TetR/AcrR family transcriptional regulator [Capnocytophaga sp.]|nr:TetR/AcrR family transcriptional regulator [Capnocytophaga sp.]